MIMENSNNTDTKRTRKSILFRLLKILLWIAVIWAALLVIVQTVLSTSILTDIVNRVADEYIDGDVTFGEVKVNAFRRFPRVSVTMDDFSITYPSERFAAEEAAGAQGELLYHGTGEVSDTLASFKRLSASVNILALASGNININHLRLSEPRIFAHSYGDGRVNWDLFRFAASEEEEDTTGLSVLPKIELGRISLTGKPHVVYTDSRDTVFAMIDIGHAGFNGKLNTRRSSRNRIGLELEDILVAGRIAADTLAFRLDELHLHEHNDHIDVNMEANTTLLTSSYGRINIPVSVHGIAGMERDSIPTIHGQDMTISIADIPISLDISLRLEDGKTGIEGMIEATEFSPDILIKQYAGRIVPELSKIETATRVSLMAACEGYYIHDSGQLPSFSAVLSIPEAAVNHSELGLGVNFAVEAEAFNDEQDKITVDISKLVMRTSGLELNAGCTAEDLLGADPSFSLDGTFRASLDTLAAFLPDTLGIIADGDLSAHVNGKILMSQMDIYSFMDSEISGEISSDSIRFSSPSDSLNASIKGLSVMLAPETVTSQRDSLDSHRMLSISGGLENVGISVKDALSLDCESVSFVAKNSTDHSRKDALRHLGGRLSAGKVLFKDSGETSIELGNTENGFQMIPNKDNPKAPLLTISSSNRQIVLKYDANRATLRDSEIKAEATMNLTDRRRDRQARLDSLQLVYPDVPRDSLMSKVRAESGGRRAPSWASEDEFSIHDIDFRLDETLAKYYREWEMKGSISVTNGNVITPYLPLRNRLRGFDMHFNNDEVIIDRLNIGAGESNLEGSGSVKGLRRALGGRRNSRSPIDVDIDIRSNEMDADELLKAYVAGMSFTPSSIDGSEDMSDEEFLEEVISDTTGVDAGVGLLVIPANIDARINIDAENITYSGLEIGTMTAHITSKDRCVQISDTKASSNFGEISFEGFYSTLSKEDIQAGFNLDLQDITADGVISLMPAVDTLVPMLKSFNGLLNCEIAATARLDAEMNIITPSINGVMRLEGRDLAISGDESISKLSKILKFKNLDEARIENLLVEGMIRDNSLEVFPFVLEIDRYTMAMSGVQNLDMSFKYHVSMIKSPMLFRFGVDLYGSDFDNMKFKVGKAKYRSADVPAFSAEIDEIKMGLAESIRTIYDKGVENALAEHKEKDAISEQKEKIGYIEAIDMEMEELSQEQESIYETTE